MVDQWKQHEQMDANQQTTFLMAIPKKERFALRFERSDASVIVDFISWDTAKTNGKSWWKKLKAI